MDQSKQRIGVLHVTFNMGIGGTEQVIRQLIQAMSPDAAVHHVVCIDGHIGAIGDILCEQGVNVSSLTRGQGFDWNLVQQLRVKIRELDIDIIHCHQYTPFVYGRLAAFGTHARALFTEHGRFYPDRYRYKAVFINPVLAMLTPAIVAISKATKSALARYEFIPPHKVEVIYNGIEGIKENRSNSIAVREDLGIPSTSLIFGTVSRLDPVKNQSMMIRAFRQCVGEYPNCHLLIVGDGPERNALEQLVIELGLEERVLFTGFIRKPAAYLAALDVFLLSSFTEGTSMTLLETMSLGIPSVATAVGGNPEIVDQYRTGVLVPNDDVMAFARCMLQLAENPSLRYQLGNGAKKRFHERYSALVMAEAYLRLYTRIIKAQFDG